MPDATVGKGRAHHERRLQRACKHGGCSDTPERLRRQLHALEGFKASLPGVHSRPVAGIAAECDLSVVTEAKQPQTWSLVLASGSGERFGSQKHIARLAGQRLVDRAVEMAWAVCDGVVVALARGEQWEGDQRCLVVEGGATRMESSKAALAAVPRDAGRVLIHDAAHPLASVALARRVLHGLVASVDAVVPVYPLADALVRAEGDKVTASVSRDGLMSLQVPMAFWPGVLRAAHAQRASATDDGSLVIALGFAVRSVPGEATNLHIATPEDLAVAEILATVPTGGLLA